MRFVDIVLYSLKSLRHRQVRSWLTILGIVIGIASVVSLLTIGAGFNAQVNKQLSGLGANSVFILPVAGGMGSAMATGGAHMLSAGKLYDQDAERLRRVPEVEEIARILSTRSTVAFKDKEIDSTVMGVEGGVFEKMATVDVESGRMLVANDRRVAVIGSNIASGAFGNKFEIRVNDDLIIDGVKYKVAGVLKKSGGGFGIASYLDGGIFIPFQDARDTYSDVFGEGEVSMMALRLRDGSNMTDAVEGIKSEMDASHKVKPDERDYSVVTPDSIQESVNTVVSLVTLFLGAIASISLIVGALAIANGMLTSVLERTHEIGVLKAVGAKNSEILNIFLFESGAVGGIGGLLGIGVGLLLGYIVSLFGIPVDVQPSLLAFAFAFSVVIGLVSGFLPARRAAKLAPVEALRYE